MAKSSSFLKDKHNIPALLFVAGAALFSFLLLTSTFNFQDGVFGGLFGKKKSSAAVSPIIKIVQPNNPIVLIGPDNAIIATVDNNFEYRNGYVRYKLLNLRTNITITTQYAAGSTIIHPWDTTGYSADDQVKIWAELVEFPIDNTIVISTSSPVTVTIKKPTAGVVPDALAYSPHVSCINEFPGLPPTPVVSLGWTVGRDVKDFVIKRAEKASPDHNPIPENVVYTTHISAANDYLVSINKNYVYRVEIHNQDGSSSFLDFLGTGLIPCGSAPTPLPSSTPTSTPKPTDPTPPSVKITSPSAGAYIKRGSTINLAALAVDNIGGSGMKNVKYYGSNGITDKFFCTSSNGPSYPCSYTISTSEAVGKYTLKAEAFDKAGNRAVSSITVNLN